jgi:pimeloyl-ACP methyl ester carboxylesterase
MNREHTSTTRRQRSALPWVTTALLLGAWTLNSAPTLAAYPDTDGVGSCNFVNPFARTSDCVQYTGENWTENTAEANCGDLFTVPYEFQFALGGVCSVPNHAADCVEDIGTADEKVNLNNATDPAFCSSLEAICNSVLAGDYFPVSGGICDTGSSVPGCEDLEPEACAAMESNERVEVTQEDTYISFAPLGSGTKDTGMIFFPGGAVPPQAYGPLAQQLAQAGIYTAVLNGPDATDVDSVIDAPGNTGLQNWALAGHSLGGVVAAKYILENPGEIAGLGLLASFPQSVDDLSSLDIKAVTIFGSNDLIATPAEVLAAIGQMPSDTLYAKIRGGNHAQFGYYEQTDDDGDADTSAEKQLELTAAALRHLVSRIEAPQHTPLETVGRQGLNHLSVEQGAINDFLSASGFGENGIPSDNIAVQRTAGRDEFVDAKASLSPGNSPEILINQYINQTGNPEQLEFPPIYDGELQSKFITQDALSEELGLVAQSPQGSCADANRDNYNRTLAWLQEAGLLSEDDQAKLALWIWNYAPDVLFPTGPEFIADPESTVMLEIDAGQMTVNVQSPSFFADLDPSNGAAAGRQYCKTLSYERLYLTFLELIQTTP